MSARERAIGFVQRHRWPLGIALGALLVRLLWNLWVHPPADYVYSDMDTYVQRARALVSDPLRRDVNETFFPVGTHYLLAATMALFRTHGLLPATLLWAAMGAALAPIGYFLTGRLHGGPEWRDWADGPQADERATLVARVAGTVLVVYYPLISYTGYFLSETPFALCVTLAALLTLRVADHGRLRDAWFLGATLAFGTLFRSQMLAVLPLLALVALLRWRELPELRRPRVVAAIVVPVLAVLAFNLALTHYHTGRATPIAQNAALNRAFGRCHCYELRTRDASWGPPPLGELYRRGEVDPTSFPKLNPAITPVLKVRARMTDEPKIHELADRCVREGGWGKQLYYGFTHVLLLWGFSPAWPDMGVPEFRPLMQGGTRAHLFAFAIPSLIALGLCVRRARARLALVVAFVLSLFVVVLRYMGDARLRVPYDAVWIAVALDVYATVVPGTLGRWRRAKK